MIVPCSAFFSCVDVFTDGTNTAELLWSWNVLSWFDVCLKLSLQLMSLNEFDLFTVRCIYLWFHEEIFMEKYNITTWVFLPTHRNPEKLAENRELSYNCLATVFARNCLKLVNCNRHYCFGFWRAHFGYRITWRIRNTCSPVISSFCDVTTDHLIRPLDNWHRYTVHSRSSTIESLVWIRCCSMDKVQYQLFHYAYRCSKPSWYTWRSFTAIFI